MAFERSDRLSGSAAGVARKRNGDRVRTSGLSAGGANHWTPGLEDTVISIGIDPNKGSHTATAVDAAGRIRPGWPYRASASLGPVGSCTSCDLCGAPCDIDCSDWRTTPILGPDNVLYLLQDAPSSTANSPW